MTNLVTTAVGKFGFGKRGSTAHLPFRFAMVLLVVAFLDVVNAILGVVLSQRTGLNQDSASFSFVAVFLRPGMAFVLMVVALGLARVWARNSDIQTRWTAPSQPLVANPSRAATIGGSLAIVIGLLMLVILAPEIQMLVGDKPQKLLLETPLVSPGSDLPLPVRLFIGLSGVFLAIWLGIQVLRKRIWARYALMGLGIIYFGFIMFGTAAIESLGGVFLTVLLFFMSWSLPLFMIWAEIKDRGRGTNMRDGWRGLLMLSMNVPTLIYWVGLELSESADLLTGVFNAFILFLLPWISLFMLGAGIWAINNDRDDSWARLNATVVVLSPLIASLSALGAVVLALSNS